MKDVFALLHALPVGSLGKILRVLADVADADPNLVAELEQRNFNPLLAAAAAKAPELVAEIIAAVLKARAQ